MTQALGMAPGMSSLIVYVGSSDSAIFNAMATASPLNGQLSSSWDLVPGRSATDLPYFEEFAGQGQNLFQAAGDSGAWTTPSGNNPVYPSDSVYVTSVGGTDLTTTKAAGPWNSESTWSSGGGGISPDHYAIPSWQKTAASGCSSCSKTYRNGPDVPPTQITPSTFVRIKPPAPPTTMVAPALPHPCGPDIWLSSINRLSQTAIRGSASSTLCSMPLAKAQAMTPISTTSPAAIMASRQPQVLIWPPAGAARTVPA